jgi:hypothetical protein
MTPAENTAPRLKWCARFAKHRYHCGAANEARERGSAGSSESGAKELRCELPPGASAVVGAPLGSDDDGRRGGCARSQKEAASTSSCSSSAPATGSSSSSCAPPPSTGAPPPPFRPEAPRDNRLMKLESNRFSGWGDSLSSKSWMRPNA